MTTILALPNIWAPFQFFAGLLSYFKSNSLNSLLIAQFKEEVEGTLTITDNRTGSRYNVPIIQNSIPALSLRQISAGTKGKNPRQQFEEGLRVLDPGYRNTAVKLSDITFM
jgi:citrate synthase